jgi:hypothetical protein
MSQSNDDKGGKKRPQDLPPEPAESDKRSGRVAFDSKGNPVWEWQLETGVYSRDVTTQKLRKLDLGDLSIADSGIHPQPAGLGELQGKTPLRTPSGPGTPHPNAPNNTQRNAQRNAQSTGSNSGKAQNSGKGGGFNPYDSGSTGTGNRNAGSGGGFNPYDSSGRPPAGAGTNPYDAARALGKRLNPDQPPAEQRRRTPADLRKLDEEIKAQRKKLKE